MSPSKRRKPRRPAGVRSGARRPHARRLWWGAGCALVIAAGAVLWWSRSGAFLLDRSSDQNVLLVTIDTLRGDALSSYGGPARTPNIDRLAARGARFTFAHSHAVVTLPSHTTILTGQYPYEHGIRDNSGFRVKDGTPTLATRLSPLGFATGAFVGGFPLTKRFGLTPGFDIYDDQMPEMRGAISISIPERPAEVVVSRAVDWIDKQEKRFFAWVHLFDPHSPYTPPDPFLTLYREQPYYGEVAWVDRALGPLLERLTTLSRATLVIVTSDHGESLGEHGELTHGMFAYESTLHVPLVVATIDPRARGESSGVVIDAPVRQIDIAPTVLDAVGVEPDRSLPGASLRELIRGGRGVDRPAYFEAMTYNLVRGWAPLRGVLEGRTKYVNLPIPELYDLATDPREERNIASDQHARVATLAGVLQTFDVALPHRPGRESAAAAAALRSLGYVSGSAPARDRYTEADDPKRLVEIDRALQRATILFQEGENGDAIALLDTVIARRADTADAYLTLAQAYWEAGRPEPAIETLERGLANGAPDHDIRIWLGIYLAESGTDSHRAIALLGGMPEDDVEALNGLGVAYSGAERYDDAIRTFERVLALDPTNGLALQNLASMVLRQALASGSETDRRSRMEQAETYARQALDTDPALPDAHTTLGVILSGTGRKGEAIESWKRAVALDGAQFNALYNLWFELAAAGRRDEAVVYGRRFVEAAPPAFFKADLERIRRYLGGA